MKATRVWMLSMLVAAAATTAAFTPAALAAGAAHSHDEAGPSKLSLDHGRRWATDATLRAGMGRIRDFTAAGIEDVHAGKMTPAQYAALAQKVELEVANIVANCKLEPQADAMLHLVIADIGAGTDAMAGKAPKVQPEKGLLRVAAAVNDYGRFFDHPGFKPVRTGH